MAQNIAVYVGPASDSLCLISVYRHARQSQNYRKGLASLDVSRRSYVNPTAASAYRVLRWIESQGDGYTDEDGVIMSEGHWVW